MARRTKPRDRLPWLNSYFLAVGVVASGLLVGGFCVFGYVHSQEFAATLGRSTGRALNGEAFLLPLRWTPSVVSSDSLMVKGGASSFF